MIERFLDDLDRFAERFSACRIERSEWTHRAHLAVGAWHVHRFGPEGALQHLRSGIKQLNESFGNKNTATEGYHETITAAYVHLINDFLRRCPAGMPLDRRVALILRGPLAKRNILLTFYSEPVLMSSDARAGWVEPDRLPLRLAAVFRS